MHLGWLVAPSPLVLWIKRTYNRQCNFNNSTHSHSLGYNYVPATLALLPLPSLPSSKHQTTLPLLLSHLPQSSSNIVSEDAVRFLNLLASSTNSLNRGDRMGFQGTCHGFGYRAAMQRGVSFGQYALKKGVHVREVWEQEHHLGVPYLRAVACAVQHLLPGIYQQRRQFIHKIGLPTITGLSEFSNFFGTLNYSARLHYDPRDHALSCAWGQWFEEHEQGCHRATSGLSCTVDWFFVMLEYGVKIQLYDGILILWDSVNTMHGTVLTFGKQYADGCRSKCWAAVTQVKMDLVWCVQKCSRT